jgi:hypothetical protein
MADYTPENIKTKSREELKEIAVSYGISNGYHGRSISKMRKSDYIDYICESLVTPTSSPTRNNLSEDSSDTPAFNAGVSQVPPNAPLRRGRTRNPQNSSPTQAEMGNPVLARVPARVPGAQRPRPVRERSSDLIIHFISPLMGLGNFDDDESPQTPINNDRRPFSARRRLDFGPLNLLDFFMGLTDSQEEEVQRDFKGEFPMGEEPEQAHKDVQCTVCLHNKICVLFQKCKHVVTCGPCGLKVKKCPMCKNPLDDDDKIRVFLP